MLQASFRYEHGKKKQYKNIFSGFASIIQAFCVSMLILSECNLIETSRGSYKQKQFSNFYNSSEEFLNTVLSEVTTFFTYSLYGHKIVWFSYSNPVNRFTTYSREVFRLLGLGFVEFWADDISSGSFYSTEYRVCNQRCFKGMCPHTPCDLSATWSQGHA